MSADLSNCLNKLETAAAILLASPTDVSPEQRREAESFLLNLRDNGLPFNICQQIFETTQNHFVMFELSQILVHNVLRQWGTLSIDDREGVYKYLLHLASTKTGLPNYVIAEFLKGSAMIVKRSSVTGEWDSSFLLSAIQDLLQSNEDRLRALGLQLIEAVAEEFSSAWRSSNISITWDFHMKAKRKFENTMLKQFMQMSLTTLSQLVNQHAMTSPLYESICDKFMRVAVIVLTWNFSMRLLGIHLRTRVLTITSTNALRPPVSWADLFHNLDLIRFFIQLHAKIRHNEELSSNSMTCLAQLASVMGEIMNRRGPKTEEPSIHELYIQTFLENLLQLFAEGIHPYELFPLSTVCYRIITYHPLVIYKRLPEPLLVQFATFIAKTAISLASPAMEQSMVHGDENYHEALSNFYYCWGILLKSRQIFPDQLANLLMSENGKVVESFIKAVTAPSYGTRQVGSREVVEENEEEEDDRKAYSDLLNHISFFFRNSLETSAPLLIRLFNERLSFFPNLANASAQDLQLWHEDMHWILLVIGF
jgi:hypothetical protein